MAEGFWLASGGLRIFDSLLGGFCIACIAWTEDRN